MHDTVKKNHFGLDQICWAQGHRKLLLVIDGGLGPDGELKDESNGHKPYSHQWQHQN